MATNLSMSGVPSSSERTCAGWVRYAQYPSRSSTTYTALYSNSPPSSGPTAYDFTTGLAAPAWRSSSRPARRCSSLRSAFQVMRLMWKIMVFSFCWDYAPVSRLLVGSHGQATPLTQRRPGLRPERQESLVVVVMKRREMSGLLRQPGGFEEVGSGVRFDLVHLDVLEHERVRSQRPKSPD